MSATRYQYVPTKVCGLERQPDGKPLTDAIKVFSESDYLAACRDAVVMARIVQGKMDINGYPCDHPDYQAAQRVIEAYGGHDVDA